MAMEKWKTILKKLLFPGIFWTILLTISSTAGLIWVFAEGLTEHPIGYCLYVLAFYTLCVLVAGTPALVKKGKSAVYGNAYANRYLTEAQLRSRVSLYLGTGVNLAYGIFKLAIGIAYRSIWFGAVAVYYMLVCLIGFLLIRSDRGAARRESALERRRYEWRRYRTAGLLMLVLNLAISGMVAQMILQNRGYAYPGYLIYAMAAYTFYRMTATIIKLCKGRRNHAPVFAAATALDLCVALVSMFALQTAMFASFGSDEVQRQLMNTATGSAVCLGVVLIAMAMIRQANKQLKLLKKR